MNSSKTYNLTLTAIITALIFVATMFTRLPTPIGGIVHLGDFMIFVAVLTLPLKHAVFASSVGMLMVNLFAGLLFWAPFTFFIKGSMAYISATIISKVGNENRKTLCIAFALAAIFGVVAYFFAAMIIANLLLAGTTGLTARFLFALQEIPSNLFQGTASVVLAVALSSVIVKIRNTASA